MPEDAHVAIQNRITAAFRSEYGGVLASLTRSLRDIERAEEALQEAFLLAVSHWPTEFPDRPGAWLLTTARRRAIDRLRHEKLAQHKLREVAAFAELNAQASLSPDDEADALVPDDQLRLIFTCCHPALPVDMHVPLTLHTLGGLSTKEIADAFFTNEVTLAQRLVRAKKKIRDAGIPYRIPDPSEIPERLPSVLAVLYLIFNAGYFPSQGMQAVQPQLCEHAIGMTEIIHRLLPEPEVTGLLALLLLQDSRRICRTSDDGSFLPISEHDRSRWDQEKIRRGTALVQDALRQRRPGAYQIQAAIAALHAEAESYEKTDWQQISLLYAELALRNDSPAIEVNRAVAVSMWKSVGAALEILDQVSAQRPVSTYQPFHAARADLLRRAKRFPEAIAAYERAIELTENQPTRTFLRERLSQTLAEWPHDASLDKT